MLSGETAGPPGQPDPHLSYVIHWTRLARSWGRARRREVSRAVREQLETRGFEANPFGRRFRVAALDEHAHAGASLEALLKVLEGFEESEKE
jgi:hypothetical protein